MLLPHDDPSASVRPLHAHEQLPYFRKQGLLSTALTPSHPLMLPQALFLYVTYKQQSRIPIFLHHILSFFLPLPVSSPPTFCFLKGHLFPQYFLLFLKTYIWIWHVCVWCLYTGTLTYIPIPNDFMASGIYRHTQKEKIRIEISYAPVYLGANLTAHRPLTKWALVKKKDKKTHKQNIRTRQFT